MPEGQAEAEAGAAGYAGLVPGVAVVGVEQAGHDRQAEAGAVDGLPGAGHLRPGEPPEEVGNELLGNSVTLVDHPDDDPRRVALDVDGDPVRLASVFEGVGGVVDQDLLEVGGVDPDGESGVA